MLDVIFNEHTLKTAMVLTIPLLLAGMGGAVCIKAGFFNIALEGYMLIGAFFSVLGTYTFNNSLVGTLIAVVTTIIYALLNGMIVFKFKANEIIVGFGFNMLAISLTGWMLTTVIGGKGLFYNPSTPKLVKMNIPLLDNVPILGSIINNQNIIFHLGWIFIIVLYVLIYKTKLGYRIRAMGENPKVLKASGQRMDFYKYIAVAISGALCGLAGSFIALSDLALFTENMIAGRGFIAVTTVIFSNGYIPITALASFLFGVAHSIGIQLQGIGIPSEFVQMTPYILTVLFLILSIKTDSIKKKNQKKNQKKSLYRGGLQLLQRLFLQ